MNTKERIIQLLETSTRLGVDDLIGYLTEFGFFESPASTRHHGSYVGGLADHSLGVFDTIKKLCPENIGLSVSRGQKPLNLGPENIIFAPLLHDVCKIGAYVRTKADDGWTNNRDKPKGHALLSIERIKRFIELTPIEEMMIKFHMGVYGLNEFHEEGSLSGEYPLRGDHIACEGMSKEESKAHRYGKSMANAWYHNPICKLMYFCDEIATLEEKAAE